MATKAPKHKIYLIILCVKLLKARFIYEKIHQPEALIKKEKHLLAGYYLLSILGILLEQERALTYSLCVDIP